MSHVIEERQSPTGTAEHAVFLEEAVEPVAARVIAELGVLNLSGLGDDYGGVSKALDDLEGRDAVGAILSVIEPLIVDVHEREPRGVDVSTVIYDVLASRQRSAYLLGLAVGRRLGPQSLGTTRKVR